MRNLGEAEPKFLWMKWDGCMGWCLIKLQVRSSNWASNSGTSRNADHCVSWCHDYRFVCIPFSTMWRRRKEISSSLLWYMPSFEVAVQNRIGWYCVNSGMPPIQYRGDESGRTPNYVMLLLQGRCQGAPTSDNVGVQDKCTAGAYHAGLHFLAVALPLLILFIEWITARMVTRKKPAENFGLVGLAVDRLFVLDWLLHLDSFNAKLPQWTNRWYC